MEKFGAFGRIKDIIVRSRYLVFALGLATSAITTLVLPAVASAENFSEYPISSSYTYPTQTTTAGGSLWYLESDGTSRDHIGNITTSGTTTDYHTQVGSTDLTVNYLTTGPDGNIWFDGCASIDAYAGVLDVSTGTLTYYPNPLTSGCSDGATPGPITTGSDGNVWYMIQDYTHNNAYTYLFSLNPSSGVTTNAWHTSSQTSYTSMVTGPDGRLWLTNAFTYSTHYAIDAFTVSSGSVTAQSTYTIPGTYVGVGGLISGPDGNLWGTESGSKIAKVTTGGVITASYTLPSGLTADKLVAGADGAVWFTSSTSPAKIGRITSSGDVTTYTVPGTSVHADGGITLGPDGAIWFGYRAGSSPMTYGVGRLGY